MLTVTVRVAVPPSVTDAGATLAVSPAVLPAGEERSTHVRPPQEKPFFSFSEMPDVNDPATPLMNVRLDLLVERLKKGTPVLLVE